VSAGGLESHDTARRRHLCARGALTMSGYDAKRLASWYGARSDAESQRTVKIARTAALDCGGHDVGYNASMGRTSRPRAPV
jgi:hypothetical protein